MMKLNILKKGFPCQFIHLSNTSSPWYALSTGSLIKLGGSMIYTDGIHLVSDFSVDELHKFARAVGLKRSWFQNHERYPHYDLTTNRIRNRAVKMGAKVVSSRQLIIVLRQNRLNPK